MRRAVKKPAGAKKRIHVQAALEVEPQALPEVAVRAVGRSRRAKQVSKSHLITHFSPNKASAFQPVGPLIPQPTPSTRHKIHQSHKSIRQTDSTSDILERALAQATAHQAKPLKRPRSHLKRQVSILAAVVLAVGVLTVIATQNLSGAQLQVASAKAGFTAKLPDYQPAGFSQSGIDSAPGIIATDFHSNSDDRSYTITQKTSSWSSADLLANFVQTTDPNFIAMSANGAPVYIYGNHNATWVRDGIWYNVESSGALSDHQLVELATSL